MARARSASPTFGSLFSGCGGFDLGFAQSGFRCAGAFDLDPIAVENHRKNLRSAAIVWDLRHGIPKDALVGVDVLVAGPPCQGFSLIGERRMNDPRNELLPLAANLASQLRPKVFVAENVAGSKSGEHREYWDKVLAIMRQAGYATREFTCIGTDYGVPQLRKRCLVIAWNTGKNLPELNGSVKGGVLRDVLQDLDGVANHDPIKLEPGSRLALIAKRLKPGQKLCNVRQSARSVHTWQIPEVFGRTNACERQVMEALILARRRNRVRSSGDADPVKAKDLEKELGFPVTAVLRGLKKKGFIKEQDRLFDLIHTFNGKYRRLEWDRPSYTVDTRFGDPRYFLHPSDPRGFSAREAARIQGFPDSYVFSGPTKAQFRMIGNAVPPPMGRAVAEFVRLALAD
jgi:DNA (cytosine-5)-methyltransferase 1